ncbi:MAG: deoxyguanosine kinase, partial [Flavobacteriales bacterium]
RTYDILSRQVPTPDLVIHLHAPIDVLLERIAERGRSYEADIDPDYLRELDSRYRSLFKSYTGARVLSVDTSGIDFREVAAVEQLVEQVLTGRVGHETQENFVLRG